jgi:hypothetical protein
MIEIAPVAKGFFQAVESGLSDNPVEAKKFSAAVFDAMGDLAAGAFGFLLFLIKKNTQLKGTIQRMNFLISSTPRHLGTVWFNMPPCLRRKPWITNK